MKKAKIKFTVSEVTNHILKMQMNMVGLTKDQLYSFYPGSLRLVSLDGNAKFSSQGSYVGVQPLEDELKVNYEIEIGTLGKHGRQGCITREEVIFYGEQVFLFPLEVVASREEDLSASVFEIMVDFQLLAPSDVRIFHHPTWWTIYDLMKSCYCFKEMSAMLYKGISLRFDPNFKESTFVFKKVVQLCQYYEEIFGGTVPDLTLYFFTPVEGEESIFGGSSRCGIGATFDFENKRDWQLLAHRLFHAFMDHYIPCKTLHLPPHVWLTEGITTYYELAAMDHVFGDCLELELAKLYEQYRYALMVDPYKFNIIPLNEAKLNSKGKIEFLHYIQAPLLIYYWQQSLQEHELIVSR